MPYHEAAPACDAKAFETVVRSRRSVRRFLPDPVPEDVTARCLEFGLIAPNSSNLQTWAFHVIQTETLRQAMNAACLSQPAATTAPLLIVCTVKPSLWRSHALEMAEVLSNMKPPAAKGAIHYYRKLIPLAYWGGPLGVLHPFKRLAVTLAGLWKPTPRQPTSSCDVRIMAHKSAALACENIMLGLRAFGFDSCPMEGLDSKRVLKLLGLGGDHEVVMAIGAGKRAEGGIYGPQMRFDTKRFVRYL